MKQILQIVGIVFVAGAFLLILVFLEENLALSEKIVPPPDVSLEEWLENFRRWAIVGIASSLVAALLWYAVAAWAFKVNSWRRANKRAIWSLLFLIPVAGIVTGFVFIQQAQEGALSAYLFVVVNGLACYYLQTALFSPSSFKYTPLGASVLRRWL